MPFQVKVPLPCLISPPLPVVVPLNVVEFPVPKVSVLPPSATVEPATPERSLIVVPEVVKEMSKMPPEAASVSPLDCAIEAELINLSDPPLRIVAPV